MPTKLEARDILFFAVGIGWSYLFAAHMRGFFTAYAFGPTIGLLLVPFLVSYFWKGRKRDWHGMAVVFVIGCFIWTVFTRAITALERVLH
jgi:hypothetical protein